MGRALDASFTQATDIAEHVMSTRGLDYRSAYQVVAHAVRATAADGGSGRDITAERLDAAAVVVLGEPLGLDADELAEVVDPVAIVATRTGTGGAAPETVRGMAERFGSVATQQLSAVRDRRERLESAEADLVRTALTAPTAETVESDPAEPVHDQDRRN
jgi:argininosuccinate lyase